MPEWVSEALEIFKDYWPFITKMLVIWYLGQVFKKRVWTKKRAAQGGFFSFMRDTMIVHPLIAGAFWGACYPFMPAVAFVETRGGAINEGLLAGFLSIAGYKGLEVYAERTKKKWLLNALREVVPATDSEPPMAA